MSRRAIPFDYLLASFVLAMWYAVITVLAT